jgi:hypothetical protein
MGWSAGAVGRASVWQFMQAWEGFREFHNGPAPKGAPTEEEFDDAIRRARGG